MTTYMIGVTPANLQSLTSLGLYEPLSDYTIFTGRRTRMDGLVIGTGYPTVKWRFNELELSQVGTLLYYVTTAGVAQASKVVYIKTRVSAANMTVRQWQNFKCVMINPLEPDEMEFDVHRIYTDVEVLFTHCEVV